MNIFDDVKLGLEQAIEYEQGKTEATEQRGRKAPEASQNSTSRKKKSAKQPPKRRLVFL